MTTFYVGQRVVLARPNYQENYGKAGVIIDFELAPIGTECLDGYTSHECNCVVQWDNEIGASWEHTDKLEPLNRRGDKITSYDTTATDEATKAMLKAIAGECVA